MILPSAWPHPCHATPDQAPRCRDAAAVAVERSSRVAILQAGPQAGSLALSSTVDMPGGCLPSSVAFDAQGRLWAAGKSTGLISGAHAESCSWACVAESDGALLQFTAWACSAESDGAVLGQSQLAGLGIGSVACDAQRRLWAAGRSQSLSVSTCCSWRLSIAV